MLKRIDTDNRCTGCNMCVAVCPVNAISLVVSTEGFWYPSVDSAKCLECSKCIKSCPVYGKNETDNYFEPVCYAGWNLNADEQLNSSSGGIFSLLARYVLGEDGTVYGAAYTNSFYVEHIRVDSINELDKIRRSKYVQSFISEELLNAVKEDLMSGKLVLFSGTPCQIAGINKLYHQFENLLTVDVVCHGVPSPKAWKSYLKEVIEENGPIKSINMRNKANGWKKFFFSTEFCDNSTKETWFNDNVWGKSFVKNLFLRESCYHCEFKNKIRCSDISLGDFWEAARGVHNEFDNEDRGTSIILVNSNKGTMAVKKLQTEGMCFIRNIPFHWIPKNTYAVTKSSTYNTRRSQAFELLDKERFSKITERLSSTSAEQAFIHRVKYIVKKLIKYRKADSHTGSTQSRYINENADVGILNVQEVDNYGAVLLCYALQTSIEKLGYTVKVIDFRPSKPKSNLSYTARLKNKLKNEGIIQTSKNIADKVFGKKQYGVNISSNLKKEHFEEFRRKYLNRTSVYRGINEVDSPIFDAYVVGSDVVWKPGRVKSEESDTYFLNFTEGLLCKRIAYAASIGTDDPALLSDIKPLIKKYIAKFDHVSLREKSSLTFINEIYSGDVLWCIDPTLLLTREEYDLLLDQNRGNVHNDYIYLYLFENNEFAYTLTNRFSQESGLPVICQCNNPDKINNLLEFCPDDGPADFIQRIKNARLVITDSFHGTVFSVIYQREFLTLSRGNISIRMKDLLGRMNLLNRYLDASDEIPLNLTSIDYDAVSEIIDEWRKESMHYLEATLNPNNRGGGIVKD